jgi:probable HAF family extracellular repeat protein
VTDLGLLPGCSSSYALGINNNGQVVGTAVTSAYQAHAFLWSSGTMCALGAIAGYSQSEAAGITASGQIVGVSMQSNGYQDRAFLYSNGTMGDLGTLPNGSWSFACGINSSGQIVGESDVGSGRCRAFVCNNDTIIDLGTLTADATDSRLSFGESGAERSRLSRSERRHLGGERRHLKAAKRAGSRWGVTAPAFLARGCG